MKNNVTVTVKEFSAPPVNMREVLRYSGGKDVENARECLKEAEDVLSYKVCYAVLDLSVENGETDFGFAKVKSLDLAKNLKECNGAVIFVATVGVGIDRLIARYGRLSPSRALFFQAIGSERAESLCDAFEDEIKKELAGEGVTFAPRFSPGYGDLSLEIQKEIFSLLDCSRRIGVSLGDSLLMTPSKSVSAIIGFGRK